MHVGYEQPIGSVSISFRFHVIELESCNLHSGIRVLEKRRRKSTRKPTRKTYTLPFTDRHKICR